MAIPVGGEGFRLPPLARHATRDVACGAVLPCLRQPPESALATFVATSTAHLAVRPFGLRYSDVAVRCHGPGHAPGVPSCPEARRHVPAIRRLGLAFARPLAARGRASGGTAVTKDCD